LLSFSSRPPTARGFYLRRRLLFEGFKVFLDTLDFAALFLARRTVFAGAFEVFFVARALADLRATFAGCLFVSVALGSSAAAAVDLAAPFPAASALASFSKSMMDWSTCFELSDVPPSARCSNGD
jgi:hypothetical protein